MKDYNVFKAMDEMLDKIEFDPTSGGEWIYTANGWIPTKEFEAYFGGWEWNP